jgi:hypothetical protein
VTLTRPGLADGDRRTGWHLSDAIDHIVAEVERRDLHDVLLVAQSWGGYSEKTCRGSDRRHPQAGRPGGDRGPVVLGRSHDDRGRGEPGSGRSTSTWLTRGEGRPTGKAGWPTCRRTCASPAGPGQYQMIENAGHYPHAEYPQLVVDAVLHFLAEIERV